MQDIVALTTNESANDLYRLCGLSAPQEVDYTVGAYQDDILIATGSLKGDMIQGLAVHPAYQGEDLSAKVITQLIAHAATQGITALYLFTKPEKSLMLSQLGFTVIAKAHPYAALLEWGAPGIQAFKAELSEVSALIEASPKGAIVMNCNPFTLGHLYLVEQAAKDCGHIFIVVVAEDQSVFPYEVRLRLIKEGTAHLKNVTVVGGGRYAVSSLTFPSYFTRESAVADAHAAIDTEIFAEHIAPALGVSKRFVGTEPYSQVTDLYNQKMKKRLPLSRIEVVEIPRIKHQEHEISASTVRRLLMNGDFAGVKPLVPETTYRFLFSDECLPIIQKLKTGAGYIEDGTKA